MDTTDAVALLGHVNHLQTRADPGQDTRPPVYKTVGILLAVASGLFIGTSFVLKKVGLLKANVKYNEEAGEGYGYLKNAYWWSGMTLMIIGEICNFVAYAFVDAILVTPLGALSVVVTTILSAIFLKERLSFVGKVGCFMCIIGSVVIVLNAPGESSAANIQEMQHFVLAPGFLSYAGVIIIGCAFVAFWVGPRYGKKSMLVYLSICSLIGGLSVVATQGLGAAVVAQARGEAQFKHWFLYVLFVFVIATLLTEIVFLNVSAPPLEIQLSLHQARSDHPQKALNIFNAALVTPTYYVYFTSATIITSAILFQGFKGDVKSIITMVLGFFVICSGVVLLQLSKSAKDVPDAAVFKGDLDQVRTVAEQAEPESEPKADAIRGTAAIIRRFSQARQKNEAAEAKRIHEERMRDQMEPIGENEHVEWDGLRRRKTIAQPGSGGGSGTIQRRKSQHPPLGLTHFPDSESDEDERPPSSDIHGGSGLFPGNLFTSFRRHHQRKDSLPAHSRTLRHPKPAAPDSSLPRRPLTEVISISPNKKILPTEVEDTAYHGGNQPPATDTLDGSNTMEMGHVYGLPADLLRGRSPSASSRAGSRPIMWAVDVSDRPHTGDRPLTSGSGRGESRSNSLTVPAPPTPPPHATNKRQFSFQNVFHRHRGNSATGDCRSSSAAPPTKSPTLLPATAPDHPPFYPSSSSSPTKTRKKLGSSGSNSITPASGLKSATEEERLGLVKGDSNAGMLLNPLPDYSDRDDDDDDDDYDDWNLEGKLPQDPPPGYGTGGGGGRGPGGGGAAYI